MRLYVLPITCSALFVLIACSSSSPSGFGASGGSNGGTSSSGSIIGGDGGSVGGGCEPNPDNFEIPDNKCDDDQDGKIDNVAPCDTGLSVAGNADDFAKALGLCQKGGKSGLQSITFTKGFGESKGPNDKQHGILPKFGSVLKAREGANLGVLSTGFAREFNDDSRQWTFHTGEVQTAIGKQPSQGQWMQMNAGSILSGPSPIEGKVPSGFPKPAAGCQVSNKTYDVIDAKIELKVPKNAKGFSFDFNFLSSEWPKYVCTKYNDSFIAYLTTSKGGDNITFDAKNNPVSVNLGFLDRCTDAVETRCCVAGEAANGLCETGKNTPAMCPAGPDELTGTGYGVKGKAISSNDPSFAKYCKDESVSGAGTGWLTTTAPVDPGTTVTLDFIIWDTGDANFDSSVLIDNFKWVPTEVNTQTVRPN